jgi:hypothetical protein
MKKPGAKTNIHVEVYPRRLGNFGFMRVTDSMVSANIEKDYIDRCEEMIEQIKRHVDDVDSAYVEFDQEFVCEFCGRDWTEDSDTYNGGCCDKDEENNPNPMELK